MAENLRPSLCPDNLQFYCEILENAWIQPPETLAVIGRYVWKSIETYGMSAEMKRFAEAVRAYSEAKKRAKIHPSDLNAITGLDKASMNLILAARELRSVVGVPAI